MNLEDAFNTIFATTEEKMKSIVGKKVSPANVGKKISEAAMHMEAMKIVRDAAVHAKLLPENYREIN